MVIRNSIPFLIIILTIGIVFGCQDLKDTETVNRELKDTNTSSREVKDLIRQFNEKDNPSTEPRMKLIALHNKGVDIVPDLLDALRDEDPLIREGAAFILCFIADEGNVPEEPLIPLLDDESLAVRVEAAGAIGIIRKDAREVLPIILEGAQSDDSDIYLDAYLIFSLFGNEINKGIPEAIPVLIDLARTTEKKSALACIAISHFGEAAVPALIDALSDSKPYVRESAARALGCMGPDAADAIPALRIALEDDEERVRNQATIALSKINAEEAAHVIPELLEGLRLDDGSGTRNRCAKALAELGPAAEDAVPVLLELLADVEGFDRLDMAFALTQISEEHFDLGYMLLHEGLYDDEDVYVMEAIRYLSDIGPKAAGALPKLKELLDDENSEYVEQLLTTAIEKIEGDD